MRKPSQLRIFALLAPPLGVLLISAAGFGQEQPRRTNGFIEFGVRQFWGEVSGRPDLPFQPSLYASKFNEYRDVTNGLFLRGADVRLESLLGNLNTLHFQAQSGFRRDQAYLVTFERLGKFKLQFRWDQAPHTFSNTAQFLYTQPSPGVFALPGNIRSSLVAAAKAPTFPRQGAPQLFDSLLPGVTPMGLWLSRKLATASGIVDATAGWTLGFQFSRERQVGDAGRPIGDYSTGVELPEPIDYRTTRIQANAEYSKPRWGIQFGYVGSIFENKIDTLVWDNAFSATDRGRIDLYPDNTSHSLNFAGAFDLTKSTRVMATIVPGWMRQNDPFLPFSINPVSAVPTPLPPLPAQSLNGSKQTLAMNYTLVSHAVKYVELTARYRSYDYNNNTPSLLFPTYVLLDLIRGDALGGAGRRKPRQSVPYEFNRKNVELAAVWEFLSKNSLKLAYEFERYNREHRDVRRSDENAFVTSLDLNPNKLTLVRISYRHASRSPNLYIENTDSFLPCPPGVAETLTSPCGRESARTQLEEFRRFDEAARTRNRGEALVQFSPLQSVSFSGSYGTIQDDYKESVYGLLKDISYYYTLDVDYSPLPQFSLFAEYAREKYRYRQRSRLVCLFGGGLCSGQYNSTNTPNNDWESLNRNVVDTWTAGMDISLAKRKVSFSAFYSLSASHGSILTRALGDSSLPGFLLDTALAACAFGGCTPQNYPDLSNRLHNVVASLNFALPRGISPKLEYRYERYDRVDWQTQLMRPYMFSVDPSSNAQIFLGADAPSYRAHVLALSLEYRF
jgi:MtrB/PioB family decaheme-associated outer membrane protein